jgi:two-component system CheB/CheR fusion protein
MATASPRPQVKPQASGLFIAARRFERGDAADAARTASTSCLRGALAFVVDPALRCLVAEGDPIHLATLRPAEIGGRPLGEVLDPMLLARLEPHCRQALDGQGFACEHEARGRAYRSRGMPLRDSDGAVSAALIVIHDITDWRQADAPLRDDPQQVHLRLALDAAGMGTFVWHLDRDRGEPDARARELFGLARANPSLDEVREALVPDDRGRCTAAIARAIDPLGTGALNDEIRVRQPDGTVRWLGITARTTFAGEPRRALRIAGVVADISERKRAEDALREREAQLTEADRRKDEFLAVLAHELRNPLAPLRAGLELIRLSRDTSAAVDRTRAIMERQVGHMVRLIDDLLDVSRITSGKIQLQRRPTPLDGLITTAVDANREAIAAARLALDIRLPEPPVWLDADPTRGVQVISNVLHNAVKFTDPGGRITITAEVEAAAGAGPQLALTIADSGVGIRPEMLPRVFDLFTQDRAVTGRSHGGLGIGLALARRLIEMQGGTIEARSDGSGRGSAFTIRLPVSREAPSSAGIARHRHLSRKRPRVLVVDDNLDAANAMAMLIAAFGGEALVARDGPTGLSHVIDWRPTLVLLDIDMPGMDGYETCRRIRAAVGSTVHVIALTGWGQEQDKREAERAGFDAHLTKPADPAALDRLLAELPQTE